MSATREMLGMAVYGAVLAMCIADGNGGPVEYDRLSILDGVVDHDQAMTAIRVAVAAQKYDRVTSVLRFLRETRRGAEERSRIASGMREAARG